MVGYVTTDTTPNSPSSTLLNVSSCSFSRNAASLLGGAIYSGMTGDAQLDNCTISANHAVTGGGAGLEDYGRIILKGSSCIGNT